MEINYLHHLRMSGMIMEIFIYTMLLITLSIFDSIYAADLWEKVWEVTPLLPSQTRKFAGLKISTTRQSLGVAWLTNHPAVQFARLTSYQRTSKKLFRSKIIELILSFTSHNFITNLKQFAYFS